MGKGLKEGFHFEWGGVNKGFQFHCIARTALVVNLTYLFIESFVAGSVTVQT